MADDLDLFEPLRDEEVELVLQLKQAVAPVVQAHPELAVFCNDWCYVRYLRARQWCLAKATAMLQATLQWRLEHRPHAITWAEVEGEGRTGKNFVSPHPDRAGRPVVVMRPRNENTSDERGQTRFLIYCLEHAARLADARRVGKMTWLVDFVGYSLRNAPSLRTSLEVLHTLQNHYPERLGCAVCYSAPSIFSLTWRAVSPFIDPVTKTKIAFVDKAPAAPAPKRGAFGLASLSASLSSLSSAASSGPATPSGAAAPSGPATPSGATAPAPSESSASLASADSDASSGGGSGGATSGGGGGGAAAGGGGGGGLEAHFDPAHVEACMGGRLKGDLFELAAYRARMEAEDAAVAQAIAAAAARLATCGAPAPA